MDRTATAVPGALIPRPCLREKLLLWGEESLSEAELLALVLGVGSRREGVESLAWRVLQEAGGLSGLARADVHELVELAGVGWAQAARIAGIFALGRRLGRQSAARARTLTTARDVYEVVAGELTGFPQERFLVLCLDGKHRLMRIHSVSLGTARTALVHPCDVFAPAVTARAVAGGVVHNHPSGDPTPSQEDLELTERLRQAGELVGVELLDHVIVGARSYVRLAAGAARLHPG